ncbi:MAG: retroviral-like aspartic protease family protein [Blastocatellia bacterium]
MGEVITEIGLENTSDRENFRRDLIPENQIRSLKTAAVVDTGARMLMLPQDMVERLGLRELRKAIVTYADGRKEERIVAGTVTVQVGEREAEVPCIVGPPAGEVLLGQVPIEIMDLVVDCAQQTIGPRPESPFLPMMRA